MSNATKSGMPCSVLKEEHQIILRVIAVLRRLVERSQSGDGFEVEAFSKCVAFLRHFADGCHHAKEEDLLFPKLEERGVPRQGGPIGCMLEEHRLARGFTKDMGDALEAYARDEEDAVDRFHVAAKQYGDLLTNHIFKEDNVLFMMGDNVMTDDDQQTLRTCFAEVGCRSFGGSSREELKRVADELEAAWPEE